MITPTIKTACALIKAYNQEVAGHETGTGYLVTPRHVATCWHVIKKADRIEVLFLESENPDKKYNVDLNEILDDRYNDCAILKLTQEVTSIEPLSEQLSVTANLLNTDWETFGFPVAANLKGNTFSGIVKDFSGKDTKDVPSIVLYSQELQRGLLQGLSGSPLLIKGFVAGHLKRIVPRETEDSHPPEAEWGRLFACPAKIVHDLLGPELTQRNSKTNMTSNQDEKQKPLIYICYADEDQKEVEEILYQYLSKDFEPWMRSKDMIEGEKWNSTVPRTIERSDFFLVCLSSNTVNKRGEFQKECKQAQDIKDEKLDTDIYLIPVKLEDCEPPEFLKVIKPVKLFDNDGLARLIRSIRIGMKRQNT